VGVGLCLIAGGAPSGDDALVMSLSKIFKIDVRWVYLFFDIVVLALSLTYIPLARILYSLLTVFLSGQIIGIMLKMAKKRENK
ncbi:MAG: YitT family protein, partial [Clostridia bacterium]|nr:YitT family protein [Clostridia bacterium]